MHICLNLRVVKIHAPHSESDSRFGKVCSVTHTSLRDISPVGFFHLQDIVSFQLISFVFHALSILALFNHLSIT